jgi:hypothetical protein
MHVGSTYANLHVDGVGLFVILAEPGDWNVRRITQALASTVLDRLLGINCLEA